MNVAAIIPLLEQLLPLGINLYQELQQSTQTGKTIEQVLAQADANWDAIAAAAKGN